MADRSRATRGSAQPKRRLPTVAVVATPLATFALGVAFAGVFETSPGFNAAARRDLLIAIGSLALIAVLVVYQVWVYRRDWRQVDDTLSAQIVEVSRAMSRLAISAGLQAEYVDDDDTGASYKRAAHHIRNARASVIFVDLWEPFLSYQAQVPEAIEEPTFLARNEFYATIIENLTQSRDAAAPVHRRVVQVPNNLYESKIPFEQDPPFREYLEKLVELRDNGATNCELRLARARIRMHFIIVDGRIVILPILSHDRRTARQVRHGALFFVDNAGALQAALTRMYDEIVFAGARDLIRSDLPPRNDTR